MAVYLIKTFSIWTQSWQHTVIIQDILHFCFWLCHPWGQYEGHLPFFEKFRERSREQDTHSECSKAERACKENRNWNFAVLTSLVELKYSLISLALVGAAVESLNANYQRLTFSILVMYEWGICNLNMCSVNMFQTHSVLLKRLILSLGPSKDKGDKFHQNFMQHGLYAVLPFPNTCIVSLKALAKFRACSAFGHIKNLVQYNALSQWIITSLTVENQSNCIHTCCCWSGGNGCRWCAKQRVWWGIQKTASGMLPLHLALSVFQ